MTDPVLEAFLEGVAEDAELANRESDILRLAGRPRAGGAPRVYSGELVEIEHLQGRPDGPVRAVFEPIGLRLTFPRDYLRNSDPDLQFRVVRIESPPAFYHPNVRGGMVCLGTHFGGGTRLGPLLEQIYRIVSYAIVATEHAFDVEARDYLLGHPEALGELRPPPPLWRRPVAEQVRVESLGPDGGSE